MAKKKKIHVGTINMTELIINAPRGNQKPSFRTGAHKSVRDYDRKKLKRELRKELERY